ncbi:MAG: hypothetical protein MUQ30_14905 [Anaerolineae bacterium]|nr:hypothetical protein [Anaerolineae bacterium]
MRKMKVILALAVIVILVAGCSGEWRIEWPRLPDKGPVDVFLGIIDQVKGIGRSVSRQFRSMSPGRR